MISKAPARMIVVKKEDKEAKLKALLQNAMLMMPEGSEICLVIQGAQSPAARAVAALAPLFAAQRISYRIIVARAEAKPLFDAARLSCRVLADPRCHDAHELVVAGSQTSWIGDSMRRNPAATDSFELHIADCTKTTAMIAASFERLWAIASPVSYGRSREAATMALAGTLAAIPGEPGSTVTVMTRH
jgi:phosphotransferase system HPr-like phosphotransfer protein